MDDPYGCLERTRSDQTGVRTSVAGSVEPGIIVFHSIVGNKVVAIDHRGEVLDEFSKCPEGYDLYRPARPTSRGNFVTILTRNDNRNRRSIAELNRFGDVIWKTKHRWFTHDFHILPNNRILSVVRENRNYKGSQFSDTVIVELDPQGDVKWHWSLWDHISELRHSEQISEYIEKKLTNNPFHINSIQFSGWTSTIRRFGEPVVIVSARNINAVFIIGRRSEKILFELPDLCLGQHHVRLLPDEYPGRGNLIVFDNGISFAPNDSRRRGSRVFEYSLANDKIVWEFSDRNFFSPIVGAQQRFSSGNTFITEGYFGRLFEVDYSGNIVWDYIYPEANAPENHTKGLHEAGLRQIYRAYKIDRSWLDGYYR